MLTHCGSVTEATSGFRGPGGQEFRSGRLTTFQLRRMLGFETREALDEFLKRHKLYDGYTADEVEQQLTELKRLGF